MSGVEQRPGFGDRVDRFRNRINDVLRQEVSDAARPGLRAELDESRRRGLSRQVFEDIGLLAYIDAIAPYIKSDGHKDVKVVWEYEPQAFTAAVEDMTAEERLLTYMGFRSFDAESDKKQRDDLLLGLSPKATVEFEWNFQEGKAANGYSFMRLELYPRMEVAIVTGDQEKMVQSVEPGETGMIEGLLVEAYTHFGTKLPQQIPPDDILNK